MNKDSITSGSTGCAVAGAPVSHAVTVIVTAYGSIQTAISAIREGAYNYIEKPFCPEKVELLIKNLVAHQNLGRLSLWSNPNRETAFSLFIRIGSKERLFTSQGIIMVAEAQATGCGG